VWGAGNILLGGSGDDLLEGRGADDIIDGDRYVNVRLSVRLNGANAGTQIGSTDRMGGLPKTGNFGSGTTGMTLQQAVFAGKVDPGNIAAVREILTSTTAGNDVALFSGPRTDYTVTVGTSGGEQFVTVNHTGGTQADGIDTLRNVETLRFTTGDVAVTSITTPTPVATVTPATGLDFGLRDTGTTATQSVTVANTGNANLNVTGATVTAGTAFAVTTNACTVVAPAGTCLITVSFAPTATGVQNATLSIAHNAAGTPTVVNLTGTGQPPVVVVSPVLTIPATTAFGLRRVGTTRTQSVRVTNTGPGTVTFAAVSPVTTTGPFTATLGTCPATLAVGASCNLAVSFAPTQIGPAVGTLTVTSDAIGSPQTVNLTGTGR
jgi:hypothetical protein